jgi:hypothetical protein
MNSDGQNAPESFNSSPEEGHTLSDESVYSLKVAVVHHDEVTRDFAVAALGRAAATVGMDSFCCTWWSVADLSEAHVLDHAVRATVAADVIVVSVRAQSELPVGLCVWTDFWLSRRPQGNGALLALIGVPEESPHTAAPTRDYLQKVAERAQLDFLSTDRPLPAVRATDLSLGA